MAYALDDRGGGQALPPYLQGRSPTPAGSQFQSQPMITPKATIRPGEVKAKPKPNLFGMIRGRFGMPAGGNPLTKLLQQRFKKPAKPAAPKITPPNVTPAGQPAQPAQPAPAQTLYEFFKKDLENQRDQALSGARSDAESRGVFYGTPLTTSQGDIQTEFQRGLGQMGAGLLQNQEQNEISRLGLATNLLGGAGQAQGGGIDPQVFQTIGSLLAPRGGPTAAPTAPKITPGPTAPVQLPKPKLQAPLQPYQNY